MHAARLHRLDGDSPSVTGLRQLLAARNSVAVLTASARAYHRQLPFVSDLQNGPLGRRRLLTRPENEKFCKQEQRHIRSRLK